MAAIFGGPANPLAAQPTLTDVPDVDLVSPPPESISSLAFSPVADHLAVGSWGPDVSASVPATRSLYLPSEGGWDALVFDSLSGAIGCWLL